MIDKVKELEVSLSTLRRNEAEWRSRADAVEQQLAAARAEQAIRRARGICEEAAAAEEGRSRAVEQGGRAIG